MRTFCQAAAALRLACLLGALEACLGEQNELDASGLQPLKDEYGKATSYVKCIWGALAPPLYHMLCMKGLSAAVQHLFHVLGGTWDWPTT